jgi:regulator of protease activity HflC (stomatin/prohibitin superfamily)
MVRVLGAQTEIASLRKRLFRIIVRLALLILIPLLIYIFFGARVDTNEFGIMQKRFGFKTGIVDRVYGAGLYFTGPGSTMHTFPRGIHVLEATNDLEESLEKARDSGTRARIQDYYESRDRLLGKTTHRVINALNVQTSDGYSVTTDITLLYTIQNPLQVAKDFGWGSLYIDSFVINTFRNSVLTTLGKMNAESFYHEEIRIAAAKEAEENLRKRFAARGFEVKKLLIRNYQYAPDYEKSLHDKKVAVQLAEKNRKEGLVNEELAKLRQIEYKGNAAITIAESEINAQISKINAEAGLYSSQTRAMADKEYNVALAEAQKLKAEAVNQSGGKYVVALEVAKMFNNIEGAVMTPEQYITFIRSAWAVMGVSTGGSVPNAASEKKQ